jgi:hypothetical protein
MINALQAFSRPDRYFDHLLYFVKGLVNYLQVHHTIPTIKSPSTPPNPEAVLKMAKRLEEPRMVLRRDYQIKSGRQVGPLADSHSVEPWTCG